MNAVAGASSAVIWQLALWPPDRALLIEDRRPYAPKIMARIAILELAVIQQDRDDVSIVDYPCTYPGCARGPAHPMESATQLANHRFAAHGIRSTNEQSIKRQERRDKHRAERLGLAPEYIDRSHIRSVIAAALAAPAGLTLKDGPLDLGEREHVRKRLGHFIGVALPREVRRSPAEICLAVAEIAASALAPVYPKLGDAQRSDIQTERIVQLFTKSSVAV